MLCNVVGCNMIQTVTCPHCQTTLRYNPERAGEIQECGACRRRFTLPPLPPDPPPPPRVVLVPTSVHSASETSTDEDDFVTAVRQTPIYTAAQPPMVVFAGQRPSMAGSVVSGAGTTLGVMLALGLVVLLGCGGMLLLAGYVSAVK